METIIVAALLVAIIGGAIWYIRKEKKSGKKCVGCPYAGSCGSNGGGCSCSSSK